MDRIAARPRGNKGRGGRGRRAWKLGGGGGARAKGGLGSFPGTPGTNDLSFFSSSQFENKASLSITTFPLPLLGFLSEPRPSQNHEHSTMQLSIPQVFSRFPVSSPPPPRCLADPVVHSGCKALAGKAHTIRRGGFAPSNDVPQAQDPVALPTAIV